MQPDRPFSLFKIRRYPTKNIFRLFKVCVDYFAIQQIRRQLPRANAKFSPDSRFFFRLAVEMTLDHRYSFKVEKYPSFLTFSFSTNLNFPAFKKLGRADVISWIINLHKKREQSGRTNRKLFESLETAARCALSLCCCCCCWCCSCCCDSLVDRLS